MLQLSHVRVLRCQLDLVQLATDDLLDPVARLLEGLVLGTAAKLDHRRERARDLRRRIRSRDVDRNALRLGVAEAWGFAAVVVLQRDDDVGIVGLAHDRDGEAEAARCLLDSGPGEPERVDLHGLPPAVPGNAWSAAPLHRFRHGSRRQ